MKTRTVKPYGMLYSEGREYFLLQPFPLESDSWEWEGEHRQAFRFVVVPRQMKYTYNSPLGHGEEYYPHARHIVTTSFNVEYADMPEILVKVIELDLSISESNFETNKEECEYE